MDKINLYCLPFAGGSKYSYRGYSKYAPSYLNIVPIEIPGRGSRVNERLLTNLDTIANDVFSQIKNKLDEPYAIYGHSMGTLIAYALTKRIIKENLKQPLYLFLTGCTGPSLRYRDLVDHLLPKQEFFREIKKLGGSPDAVLNDPILMDFFEPILRADFEAVATYNYERSEPFSIPISVIIGAEENASFEEAMAWQQETTLPIEVKTLPGNHFFIFDHEATIIQSVAEKLSIQILQL